MAEIETMASIRFWLAPALLPGLVVGSASVALAAPPDASEQSEMTALQKASISPAAAIKAAESHTSGKALIFGYEVTRNVNAYEVTVQTPSDLRLVRVDPSSGAIAGSKVVKGSSLAEDGLSAAALSRTSTAPGSLAEAVSAAEKKGGGRALEANYALRNGQWVVDVDVPTHGQIRSFHVNPATGAVR